MHRARPPTRNVSSPPAAARGAAPGRHVAGDRRIEVAGAPSPGTLRPLDAGVGGERARVDNHRALPDTGEQPARAVHDLRHRRRRREREEDDVAASAEAPGAFVRGVRSSVRTQPRAFRGRRRGRQATRSAPGAGRPVGRPPRRGRRGPAFARSPGASIEVVEPGAVVPEDLALALVGKGLLQEGLHRVRVARVGVREVSGEHDGVVPESPEDVLGRCPRRPPLRRSTAARSTRSGAGAACPGRSSPGARGARPCATARREASCSCPRGMRSARRESASHTPPPTMERHAYIASMGWADTCSVIQRSSWTPSKRSPIATGRRQGVPSWKPTARPCFSHSAQSGS